MTVPHDDPYRVLGVSRDADQAAIRRAYRTLAKTYHPDMNPGDTKAEDMFKKISRAYDILGDEDKRARFDRGEIGPDGAERAGFGAHGPGGAGFEGFQAGGDGPFTFRWSRSTHGANGASSSHADGAFSDSGFADLFSDLFAHAGAGPRGGGFQGTADRPRKGADSRRRLTVSFEEAAVGAKKTLRLDDGATVAVRVPAGIEDGHVLRLKGKGRPAPPGGRRGDALVEVTVAPHARFRRDGLDVHVEVPVSLVEAVLGGKVTVPTPSGPVSMAVPANTSSGRRLRLKGRGIHKGSHKGDLLARVMIVLPDPPDAALEAFVRDWSAQASDREPDATDA